MRVTTYSIRFSKFENELQNGESNSGVVLFCIMASELSTRYN